jgi:hypothetical protein
MRLSSARFSCSSFAHSPAPVPPHSAAASAAFHAARTAAQHRRTTSPSPCPGAPSAGPEAGAAGFCSTFLSHRPSLLSLEGAGGGGAGGLGGSGAAAVFLSQRLSLLFGSPCRPVHVRQVRATQQHPAPGTDGGCWQR